jgi:hypothetical protein
MTGCRKWDMDGAECHPGHAVVSTLFVPSCRFTYRIEAQNWTTVLILFPMSLITFIRDTLASCIVMAFSVYYNGNACPWLADLCLIFPQS